MKKLLNFMLIIALIPLLFSCQKNLSYEKTQPPESVNTLDLDFHHGVLASRDFPGDTSMSYVLKDNFGTADDTLYSSAIIKLGKNYSAQSVKGEDIDQVYSKNEIASKAKDSTGKVRLLYLNCLPFPKRGSYKDVVIRIKRPANPDGSTPAANKVFTVLFYPNNLHGRKIELTNPYYTTGKIVVPISPEQVNAAHMHLKDKLNDLILRFYN